MNKPISRTKKFVTYSLCWLLTGQPALANVVVDNSNHNTSKGTSLNGVEVINIATPNGKGLSHNQYTQFNVDKSGLILNNSTAPVANSQLGGIIDGNTNLNGQAASVILNEVTGANQSQLNGYTEVFGQQANVILSNPYGITCNGCGFINTPRVTLSTGAAELVNGEVSGFDVSQGMVNIEGLGLDASNQTYFDIISRSAAINAEIHAQDLNIVTGQNKVTYQTNQVTEKVGDGSPAPTLAIDSSALGGMYAGRISLVATEDGVGVNVGNLSSSTQGMSITADGKIIMGDAASAQNITLNSSEQVVLSGTQKANQSITIQAASLTASNNTLEAGQALNLQVNEVTQDASSKMNATDISMAGLQTLNNQGTVNAKARLTIDGDDTTLTGTGALTAEQAELNSTNITIDTNLLSETLAINSAGTVVTTTDANVVSNKKTTIDTATLHHQGKLHSGDTLTIIANTVNQDGRLSSATDVNINANTLNNQSVIKANRDINIKVTENVTNSGSVIALNDVNTDIKGDLTNTGLLYAGNDATYYVKGTLSNTGADILTGRNMVVQGDAAGSRSVKLLNSSGTIETLNGDMSIAADTVENKRMVFETANQITNDNRGSNYAQANYTINGVHPDAPSFEVDTRCRHRCSSHHDRGGRDESTVDLHGRTSDYNRSFRAFTQSLVILNQSTSSTLLSNGNLTINADNVVNGYSQISADSINISANSLSNLAFQSSSKNVYYDYELYRYGGSGSTFSEADVDFTFKRNNIRYVNAGSATSINSSITATGDINLNVTGSVDNTNIKAHDVKYNSGIPTPGEAVVEQTPTLVDGDDNEIAIPEFELPTNGSGLFVINDGPDSDYVIETNPDITDLGIFLGSDYFINKVGFNPEEDVQFLGDAFYDTRVITQAILEQTGQRYLTDKVGTDFDQMQQLLDSAASQSELLGLEVGVALTPEQIAGLTRNIVWWEPVRVGDKTVLAPKLYLSKVTQNNIQHGALIAGSDVSVSAGNINNSGSMDANGNLTLVSQNEIMNDGGQLTATGNTALVAQNDIINLSGTISGNNVNIASVDGSLINKTYLEQYDLANGTKNGNMSQAQYIRTKTILGDTAKISSTGDLTINVGNNIENSAANLLAGGNANLTAGNDVIFNTQQLNETNKTTGPWRRTSITKTETHLGSEVNANGGLTINAGNNIDATGTDFTAGGNLVMNAGNDVSIKAAVNKVSNLTNRGSTTTKYRSIKHDGSSLSGENVVVNAGNNMTLQGSGIAANDNAVLMAKGDVNVLAVNDSEYHYSKTVQKKSFGRSKTTINERMKETVVGSNINANNITIQAQKLNQGQIAGGDSDIKVVGSELNAASDINLTADGDITIAAQKYIEYNKTQTIKKGFGGLSSRDQGTASKATKLASGDLLSGQHINLNSGNNIAVLASNIISDGNVNLTAIDEVLVAAAEVLKETEQWNDKTSFLQGGNLFEMQKQLNGETSSSAQGSLIQSGNNIQVDAGRIKAVGSDMNANNNTELNADTGNIEILAAKESSTHYSKDQKIMVGMGDMSEMVSLDDGKLKIKLGEATYDKVDSKTEASGHSSSNITANNNVDLNSASDILVEGSNIIADSDASGEGSVSLAATDSIVIKEAKDKTKTTTKEVHGKAEVSFVVQHQAAEVVKAVIAVEKAKKKLKQSKKDYEKYKKQLKSLDATLDTIEQEYAQKKPGVNYEDIEDLEDLISQIESDEEWYVAGIALAAVDLTSKITSLVQQSVAAAQSTGTYGFNAGIQLDIEGSKTKSENMSTSSLASNIAGNNITIKAGDEAGNQALVQGSHLQADESISISANEVNIKASKDTASSKSHTDSGTMSASVTVYGASSGVNLSGSLNRSESKSDETTYTNSTVNANNITIASTNDTNIIGANVNAEQQLDMTVGGDLNVESVRNRSNSSSKGIGISGGISLSGGEVSDGKGSVPEGVVKNTKGAGDVTGFNGGLNASSGRTNTKQTVLTSLTSGGGADITVGKNTKIKGALIGTIDEQGKDLGNLNLETDTLSFVNLTNTNYSQNRSVGVNTSVSVGPASSDKTAEGSDKASTGDLALDATNNTSSLQYQNGSSYGKSKTLATLGLGNIVIKDSENSDDITALNRDVANTEKAFYQVERQQGDFDVTVDHRLLTEEGRKGIKEDLDRSILLGEALVEFATADSVSVMTDAQDGETGLGSHIKRKQDFYSAAKEFYNDNKNARNRDILANPEKYSPEDRQNADQAMINYIAETVGVKASQVVLVLDDERKGFYSDETSNVYISDNSNTNAKDTVTTVANEASHMIDAQEFGTGNKSKVYKDNREEYSTIIDDAFADKLDNDYASNGYDLTAITHQNSNTQLHSVSNQPKQIDSTLTSNTKTFNTLDKEKGANSLVPGADRIRWLALKGKVPIEELTKQENAQDKRIVDLTGEKLKQYGEEAVEMAEKMPETIVFLLEHPEELKKLPGHVQKAMLDYVEHVGDNVEVIGKGLVTNNPEAIEAQAQAESDLLADLITSYIGAGIGKVGVIGGKLVVKKTAELANKLNKVGDGTPNSKPDAISSEIPELDAEPKLASKTNTDKIENDVDVPNTDNSNNLHSRYRQNTDGSITGPHGGKAWDTGYSDANGKPIYQRESGGYYTIESDGKQIITSSPKPHGNTLDNTPTQIYRRVSDLDDSYQKTGISNDAHKRYAAEELGFDRVDVVGTRPRTQAAKLERFIVERWPGPLNKEPWAGKRNPNHPNYDPNYIPPHLRK